MLDDTLVVWGGEFGRTPFGQGDPDEPKGRDHFGRAYSWWLAGGGIKPGTVYGATDDFGWNITDDPVHVHDMQATILHLCGIDHTRLTFRYQGRQYRLTDVHGKVVKRHPGLNADGARRTPKSVGSWAKIGGRGRHPPTSYEPTRQRVHSWAHSLAGATGS